MLLPFPARVSTSVERISFLRRYPPISILLFLSFLLSLTGCSKPDPAPTTIHELHARYIDYDCTPISGKELIIEQSSHPQIFTGGQTYVNTATTDDQGSFVVQLKGRSIPSFYEKELWGGHPYHPAGLRISLTSYNRANSVTLAELRSTSSNKPLLIYPLSPDLDNKKQIRRITGNTLQTIPLSYGTYTYIDFNGSNGTQRISDPHTHSGVIGFRIGENKSPSFGNKWSLSIYSGQINGLLERTDSQDTHNSQMPVVGYKNIYVIPADELLTNNTEIKKSFYFKASDSRIVGKFDLRVYVNEHLNISAYISYDYLITDYHKNPETGEYDRQYIQTSDRILRNRACNGVNPFGINNVSLPKYHSDGTSDLESKITTKYLSNKSKFLKVQEERKKLSNQYISKLEKNPCLIDENIHGAKYHLLDNKETSPAEIDRLVNMLINSRFSGCANYNDSFIYMILGGITEHKHTSSHSLRILFDKYGNLRSDHSAFRSHANLPADIQQILASGPYLLTLARNKNLDPVAARYLLNNALQRLMQDASYHTKRKVYPTIRALIANPNTPQDVLLRLMNYESTEIAERARETLGLSLSKI